MGQIFERSCNFALSTNVPSVLDLELLVIEGSSVNHLIYQKRGTASFDSKHCFPEQNLV